MDFSPGDNMLVSPARSLGLPPRPVGKSSRGWSDQLARRYGHRSDPYHGTGKPDPAGRGKRFARKQRANRSGQVRSKAGMLSFHGNTLLSTSIETRKLHGMPLWTLR